MGANILYRNVFLEGPGIVMFVRRIRFAKRHFTFVRSLTIRYDKRLLGSRFYPLRQVCEELAPAISVMDGLVTFSFTIGGTGELVEPDAIHVVLRSIPHTVENLELDTMQCDQFSRDCHLCETILPLLSHVKRLRLRLKHLCPSFLPLTAPVSLVSALIIQGPYETTGCGHPELAPDLLLRVFIRANLLRGLLPSIRHFSIIRYVLRPLHASRPDLVVHHIPENAIHVFPLIDLSRLSYELEGIVMRTSADQMIFGGEDVIESIANSGKGWAETIQGSRFPEDLPGCQDYIVKQPSILDCWEVISDISRPQALREELKKAALPGVRVIEGLLLPEERHLIMVLPPTLRRGVTSQQH